MKNCITTLLKDNCEGLCCKELQKKSVKVYLSQHSETEMQPKRKQEAKSLYDEVLTKLADKGKVLTEGDIVKICESKTSKKDKKDKHDKKEKKEKKRKRDNDDALDESVGAATKEVATNGSTDEDLVATPAPPTPVSEGNEKKKQKRVKSEKIGFNVDGGANVDINPHTGKKLKKRSKEAYERRKARYLLVKKLDSRNKRQQGEFEANKRWMNSGKPSSEAFPPSVTSSYTPAADPAPTYTSF